MVSAAASHWGNWGVPLAPEVSLRAAPLSLELYLSPASVKARLWCTPLRSPSPPGLLGCGERSPERGALRCAEWGTEEEEEEQMQRAERSASRGGCSHAGHRWTEKGVGGGKGEPGRRAGGGAGTELGSDSGVHQAR